MVVPTRAVALVSAVSLVLGIAAFAASAEDGAAESETPLPWIGEAADPAQAAQAAQAESDPPGQDPPLLDAIEARDPRVVRADASLGDRSTYGKAAELYRAYLAEVPDDDAVRLRLARVLSWHGRLDEAIAEYDAIAGDSADPEVRVERAETLSWAGRYRESEDAFDAILAEQPRNARAARGLARVFLWSGRSHEADRAYARALEIEDDGEARSEWEGLHALYRPQVKTRVSRRSDNDDYFFQSVDVQGTTYLDLRTRVSGEASYWRTRGEVDLGAGRRERESLDGAAYRVGVERHFGPSWLALVKLGHEAWGDAPDQVLANAELRFTPADRTSLSLDYEHSGAGRALESFDAALEGVHRDELSLSLWRGLPAGFEIWGRVGGGWISDSNRRLRADLSLDYKPLEDRELRIHWAASLLRYGDDSELYYDPDLGFGHEIGTEYVQPLWLGVRVRVEAAAGYGVSRDRGFTSDGFVFRTGSYLWWEWQRWALEVGGTFAQSRRESVYRSKFFTASIARSF